MFVGRSIVYLQSLSYGLDFDDTFPISNDKGEEEGRLHVYITPCDKHGKPIDDTDFYIEDPEQLLGKPFHFQVGIEAWPTESIRPEMVT